MRAAVLSLLATVSACGATPCECPPVSPRAVVYPLACPSAPPVESFAHGVEPEPPPLIGWPRSIPVHPTQPVAPPLPLESHPLLAPIDEEHRRLPLRSDAGVAPELELRILGP